jgi:hypothetical protein
MRFRGRVCRSLSSLAMLISTLAHGQAVLSGNSFTSSATPKINYSVVYFLWGGLRTQARFSLAWGTEAASYSLRALQESNATCLGAGPVLDECAAVPPTISRATSFRSIAR